jgi:hypothetical protein
MPVSKETRRAVSQLAELVITPSGTDLSNMALKSFKTGPLRGGKPGESLTITDDEYLLYRESLARLAAEPELEHITAADVDTELWNFLSDLFLDQTKFRNMQIRNRRVRALLDALRKPWQTYEALTPVANLVMPPGARVNTLGVLLRRLTQRAASDWRLNSMPTLLEYESEFVGQTVALVNVDAGSVRRAAERARDRIDDALHAIRFGISGSILFSIPDEQLLARRGIHLAVKDVSKDYVELHSFDWPRQPIPFQLAGNSLRIVKKYLAPLDATQEGTDAQARLKRAIHWIGLSVTDEEFDDKVVRLCTALETLLCTKDDRKKGEAMAFRSILLSDAIGQGFRDPVPIYDLYEKRSDIIHGSAHRVCGRGQYSFLLYFTCDMTAQYARFVARNKAVTKHTNFIEAIQRRDKVEQAIDWLEHSLDPGKRIARYARDEFARRKNHT